MKIAIQLFISCLFLTLPVTAQVNQLLPKTEVDTSANQESNINLDSLGRNTPRGSVIGLFKALSAHDIQKAFAYFAWPDSVKALNDSAQKVLMNKVEITLNKKGRMFPNRLINDEPDGDHNDNLGQRMDEVGSIELSGKKIPILLQAEVVNEKQNIWLVSETTTQELIRHIERNRDDYTDEKISKNASSSARKGNTVVEWIAMIGLGIGSFFVAYLATLLLKFIVRRFWKNYNQSTSGKILDAILIPSRLVLMVVILLNISRVLEISIATRQAFGVINLIAMWSALFVFLWLLINALSSFGQERLKNNNKFGGLSIISFFQNVAKFSLVIIAILIIFDTLGFNITAGIAALGVGGIALALGAQKTVENLVGGLSIIFDRPVNVGDFCKFGDTIGTVENIGVRSTRIRTLNRTLVSIPNADFSTRSIENYAPRDMFLFRTTLGLRYETSSDQMRYILIELRKILYAHPKVDPDPARVRFLGYASDCLQVEIYAYTHAVDWNDFLGIQEDINLRIAKVIENSGSGFAFPSQTLYLTKDKGLSEEKKVETELKVKKWIENQELNLPDFDDAEIRDLKDTLNYPPQGSSSGKPDK